MSWRRTRRCSAPKQRPGTRSDRARGGAAAVLGISIGIGLATTNAAPLPEQPPVDAGATAWMLTSTALVLLMVPGLAMFYGGLVRTKNVLGTMMHSFAAMAVIGVIWVVIGYALAFGPNVAGRLVRLGSRPRVPPQHRRHGQQQRHPGPRVRDVPGQVRDHHPGADRGRLRRAGAVPRLRRLHRALEPARLQPAGALGVGAGRLPVPAGRHRLRGRHRRPHLGGHQRPDRRALPGRAARLSAHRHAPQQPGHGDDGRRPALGGLVRLQRRQLAVRAA